MIKLHGFSASNYYNVPKLALLEKGIAFEEVLSYSGAVALKEVEKVLAKAVAALPKLSSFEQFAYGDQFTLVDITAILNLPIERNVGKAFLGRDPLSEVPGLTACCQRIEEHPHVNKVRADATSNRPDVMAHLKSLYGF